MIKSFVASFVLTVKYKVENGIGGYTDETSYLRLPCQSLLRIEKIIYRAGLISYKPVHKDAFQISDLEFIGRSSVYICLG